MRPHNTLKAIQKMHNLFQTYFEPVEPEKLTINLNPHGDIENHVPRIREKAVQIFGRKGLAESMDWVLAPGDYLRAINFILENHPSPKPPSDPIWLSFTCGWRWKSSALPNIDWPEEFLKPGNEQWQRSFFIVNMRIGGRVSFPMGMQIPISLKEPASYEFLGRFSAEAPFKMNPKHFQVIIPIGKKGNWACRKPDADVFDKLLEVIK